jgi:Protein of unknown function (DUF3788)
MAPSAFLDRSSPPKASELEAVLGRAGALWAGLHAALSADFAPVSEKWSYSGKAYGWSLQLRRKTRTILYMIPGAGRFVAAFALGEKACAAARQGGLPPPLLEAIRGAKRYPEGRAVRLEVRSKKDVTTVRKLAAIKMAN